MNIFGIIVVMVMTVVISRYWYKKEARMYKGCPVLDQTKRQDMIENVLVCHKCDQNWFMTNPRRKRDSPKKAKKG